jgi:phospholipid/cholesterol/gamma-HCH transport system substrate-binding protein
MRSLSTELKVGFFALFVLAVLAFMTFRVGGLDWMRKEGTPYYVSFKNIAGLNEKTKVKIAGVDTGIIEKIELKEGEARLMIRLDKGVQLSSDAIASIKASGLLGDKYLDIKPGSHPPFLRQGDTIRNVLEVVDIDEMLRKLSKVSDNISALAESLNESLGTDEAKRSLKAAVLNLGEITENLNRTIATNDQKMQIVLENVNKLTASLNEFVDKNKEPLTAAVGNLNDFSSQLKKDGPDLIANLNKAANDLKAMVEENRPAVKSTVESFQSIAEKIDKGEGSLGKLVKDDRLYESVNKAAEGVERTISAVERFRTFVTFQTEYLTRSSEGKGYFYVTFQPRPDKYYILGVVGDPLARVKEKTWIKTTSSGTVRIKEEDIEEKIEFTAQFAKRFDNLALRIGVTENSFGVGGDYFFNNDKGKITADAWDFGSDEEGADNPHIKIGIDYFLFKNLFVSAGADNILSDRWRGGYAGVGLRFEDQDLKYLFGTLPRISAQ